MNVMQLNNLVLFCFLKIHIHQKLQRTAGLSMQLSVQIVTLSNKTQVENSNIFTLKNNHCIHLILASFNKSVLKFVVYNSKQYSF